MRSGRRHLTVCFVAAIAITMAAQKPAIDDRAAATFLRELQRAVARDDRTAVSTLIQYPLTVFAGGIRIPIPDAAAMLQSYDVVFTPALKMLIARAAIPLRGGPAPATPVMVMSDVISIGVDNVRIESGGSGLNITRITVPLGASSAGSSAPVSRGSPREPQRLFLGVGRIQRSGALGRGERDAYLLSAMKNQLLEIRITGVSGRDIVVRIMAVKTRALIDSRADAGVRTWIGRVPEDDDYRIDVVRLAPGGASRLPYVMVVSMR